MLEILDTGHWCVVKCPHDSESEHLFRYEDEAKEYAATWETEFRCIHQEKTSD